jgi:mannosyl-3-phosphoglycerate phosphatase
MEARMPYLVVCTDLDGTLLDPDTYSFEPASPALEALRAHDIPLILVSSKTRAEIEPLRARLENQRPFIAENGGAAFIPKGYFPVPPTYAMVRGPYQVVEFGVSYGKLRIALKELERIAGCELRGFGDMLPEEIVERTGLQLSEAMLAKQREYDEPFLVNGPSSLADKVRQEAEARGFQCTRGGRFLHLTGRTDKGRASRYLFDCYRQSHNDLFTVGLGDSLNDLPLLAAVDQPILLPHADGSYEPSIHLPKLIRAPGRGPIGWNQAVLDRLQARGPRFTTHE